VKYQRVGWKTIYLLLVNDKISSAFWNKEDAFERSKQYITCNSVTIKEIRMKGEFVEEVVDK